MRLHFFDPVEIHISGRNYNNPENFQGWYLVDSRLKKARSLSIRTTGQYPILK